MKKHLPTLITVLLVPAVIVGGTLIFDSKRYAFISIAVAILALLQFMLSFEKKETSTVKLVIIAVMTALSVAGRVIFAVIPGFKPVTAIVIITAIYLGKEAGFITGALSAVLSNLYFGQGPWTPFQMLSWGLIGWVAGVISKKLESSKPLISIYGFLSGIAFSVLMDIWYTLWQYDAFNINRFLASATATLPHTIIYAVSNVIFLLLLTNPVGKKLKRLTTKYGV